MALTEIGENRRQNWVRQKMEAPLLNSVILLILKFAFISPLKQTGGAFGTDVTGEKYPA